MPTKQKNLYKQPLINMQFSQNQAQFYKYPIVITISTYSNSIAIID